MSPVTLLTIRRRRKGRRRSRKKQMEAGKQGGRREKGRDKKGKEEVCVGGREVGRKGNEGRGVIFPSVDSQHPFISTSSSPHAVCQ